MANTFASMKKNKGGSLEKITKELDKLNKKTFTEDKEDDRFWRVTKDKSGNGSAIIRFLPAPEGEDLPWVRYWHHSFQGANGKWYIEKSLTTLGQTDPVSEYNSELWNTGVEANQNIARKQKRKLTYVSNILVIKDPGNPDNEGKVFLFEYGTKVFDKITDITHPESDGLEDAEPIDPFDLWNGANFKLKVRKVDGFFNYDKSEFMEPSPAIEGGDAALEALFKKEHKLLPLIEPSQFKSYEQLKARLKSVLGEVSPSTEKQDARKSVEVEMDDVDDDTTEVSTDDVDDDTALSTEDEREYLKSLIE